MRTVSSTQVDPKLIVIHRDSRQRQEGMSDIADLQTSISRVGIINPIVVRSEEGKFVLVAGERRLTAALALGLKSVPIRNFKDLSRSEAEIIELEENVKRKELEWRDHVRAVGRIHALYRESSAKWTIEQTADAISLHHTHVRKILHVFDALASGRINGADSIDQAFNTLHRFAERKAESIVSQLIVEGGEVFAESSTTSSEDSFTTHMSIKVADDPPPQDSGREDEEGEALSPISYAPPPPYVMPTDPVICENFLTWAASYAGPKFSFIHCDFPYGNYKGSDSKGAMSAYTDTEEFYDNTEGVYWTLLDGLCANLDRLMSYSAHLVFWFNMNFYTETVSRLRKGGLFVHDHPLIWHKTGGPGGLGVAPGSAVTFNYPRRTYDTALLAVRGNRPMVKSGLNSYAAPTAGNKIHPSQKPEPMLRFFLSMLIDETTTVLDPTCGSAAALRAAEDLGAKYVLGLEMDPNYAKVANTKTLQARVMRQAGQMAKREE